MNQVQKRFASGICVTTPDVAMSLGMSAVRILALPKDPQVPINQMCHLLIHTMHALNLQGQLCC